MDARCVTPPEAAYRLYGFYLYQMYSPVLQLTIHLPGMHMVAYNERDDLRNVINYEQS
jgi:ATP-dependent DNA helicase PIF1